MPRSNHPSCPVTSTTARAVPPPIPSLVLLVALAASSLGPSVRAGTLDDEERARADALARAVPWGDSGVASPAPAREPLAVTARGGERTGAAHALGVQTLAVEGAPVKGAPSGERRARVYQHDHATRRTRRVEVDVANGAALDARELDSPHLPLSDAERVWALGRLAADGPLLDRLRDEQRRRGRAPFASLGELDVKAIVFEPTDPAHPCARERCALLSLFDATRTVFATEPLVHFASGSVDTLDALRGTR